MRYFANGIAVLSLLSQPTNALLNSQNTTFNSTFRLTTQQIAAANLSDATAHNVQVALNYERSNNAGSLTQDDPFYVLPDEYDAANPPPIGTIIKVEEHTNLSLYTIPMSISMSRFLYVSETLNGSAVPASAYVLWPYLPRTFSSLTACSGDPGNVQLTYPVVGLVHGTSGQTQACAPSNMRALWDDWGESHGIMYFEVYVL